jgi:hypothetical protein
MSHAAPLFPMFVKLAGHRCLVVGGGSVAEGKIESLIVWRECDGGFAGAYGKAGTPAPER